MVDARKPAAAGVFYPADRDDLARLVRQRLEEAEQTLPASTIDRARAIVVPHGITGAAGIIASKAWARVDAGARVERVLLLGPSHHVHFAGFAAPFADSFTTPLGAVVVDRLAIEGVRRFPQLTVSDMPHEQEPSLEAQLPFVQTRLETATIVPLVVGEVTDEEAIPVIDALWDDVTLVVVSTDLSRYFDAVTARDFDEATARAIERLDGSIIGEEQACGHAALRALLLVARARGLRAARLDLGHSGSSPDQDDVVGFGAFVIG